MKDLKYFLTRYIRNRPLFLSLIRAKEAYLYQNYLPLKKPVLDVGCGDGFFSSVAFHDQKASKTPRGWPASQKLQRGEPAYKDSPEVKKPVIDVGLDVKDSRIEEARKIGLYKKIVTFDGKIIPFADNYFSTVVSNCVLEHVEDLDILVSEIFRVLKPGGIFLTTVMAKPWEENLFGTLLLGKIYKNWMRKKQMHLNLLTVKQWNSVFKKSGFKVIEKTGYLVPVACRLIDICHYLSVPSLVTYKLFGRWVLFPGLSKLIYPISIFARILSENADSDSSGAIFYILRK